MLVTIWHAWYVLSLLFYFHGTLRHISGNLLLFRNTLDTFGLFLLIEYLFPSFISDLVLQTLLSATDRLLFCWMVQIKAVATFSHFYGFFRFPTLILLQVEVQILSFLYLLLLGDFPITLLFHLTLLDYGIADQIGLLNLFAA